MTKADAEAVAAAPPEAQRKAVNAVKAGKAKRVKDALPKAAEPEPETEHVDQLGWPLPEKLKPAFALVPRFLELMKQMSHIRSELKELGTSPAGLWISNPLDLECQNLRWAIKHAAPYAICPYCKAKEKSCEACRGSGWVASRTYESAPSEMKRGKK